MGIDKLVPRGKQVLSIQYFRAAAALMVVAHHGHQKLPWLIERYPYKLGEAGVDIFFVISGFVMVYITNNSRVGCFDFLRDRVTRIVPLYWLATMTLAALVIVRPSAINDSSELTVRHLLLS